MNLAQHPKLDALNRLASQDARHPSVKQLARQVRAVAEHAGDPERVYALLCSTLARDAVKFQTDTQRVGAEDIAGLTRPAEPPLAVLWRGVDDCDAKARLFVALCRAGGICARVNGEVEHGELTHVWPEVHLGKDWIPSETTLARARLGDPPHSVPKETSGRWLYS